VIGCELELPGLLGPLQAGRNQAGVVDQQVQRAVPLPRETGHAARVGKVDGGHGQPGLPGRCGDAVSDACAGPGIADGEGDVGARDREDAGRLRADPRGCAGDHRPQAVQVNVGDHLLSGAQAIEARDDEGTLDHPLPLFLGRPRRDTTREAFLERLVVAIDPIVC
jgi:hypothetical protein